MTTLETNCEEKTTFKFEELSKAAKRRAIMNYSEGEPSYNWWEYTYEDAANVGIKITEFDCQYRPYAKGEFIDSDFGVDCGRAILKQHGPDCDTYKAAAEFMADAVLREACWDESKEGDFFEESDAHERADEFLKKLLDIYARMLKSELEYLQSDECAEESIKANDYDFDAEGNMV